MWDITVSFPQKKNYAAEGVRIITQDNSRELKQLLGAYNLFVLDFNFIHWNIYEY